MDVDQDSFRKVLLDILINIANADYVILDLEMSGINGRQPGTRHSAGKPSLQDLYEEIRAAAEIFQILQLGITCVGSDVEKEYYLARPYNFNVSPKSADGIDLKLVKLERVFSFSSSACDFLAKNKFDFGKIFTHGVPYLSRDEENAVRGEYSGRADRNAQTEKLRCSPSDVTTLEFVRGVRRTISTWVKTSEPKPNFVNISHPDGHIKDGRVNGLSAYQRRWVYQIVRDEFPTLKAVGRNDGTFMQVTKLDVVEEARFQAKKLLQLNKQICRQKGLRWIFEALVHGDLSGIDPEWLASKTSEDPEDQLPAVKKQLARIIKALRRKQHVLVGHNLFMDLAFIHKTFVGPLPLNVGHFQESIHRLFPIVIDTKYLATHNVDAMSSHSKSNLKELLAPFKKEHLPLIVLHEEHTGYGGDYGKEHEAGFDSWMTAELFIKLSAKLYSKYDESSFFTARTELSNYESSPSDSDSSGGAALITSRSPSKSPQKSAMDANARFNTAVPAHLTEESKVVGYTSLSSVPGVPQSAFSIATMAASTAMVTAMSASNGAPSTQTGFASPNKSGRFNSRPSMAIPIINPSPPKTPDHPDVSTSRKTITQPPQHLADTNANAAAMQASLPPSYHANKLNPSAKVIHDTDEEAAAAAAEPKVEQFLPDMESPFWRPYANILRVNAVEGGICDLAEPVLEQVSDS